MGFEFKTTALSYPSLLSGIATKVGYYAASFQYMKSHITCVRSLFEIDCRENESHELRGTCAKSDVASSLARKRNVHSIICDITFIFNDLYQELCGCE
jgi:hypothetical protein